MQILNVNRSKIRCSVSCSENKSSLYAHRECIAQMQRQSLDVLVSNISGHLQPIDMRCFSTSPIFAYGAFFACFGIEMLVRTFTIINLFRIHFICNFGPILAALLKSKHRTDFYFWQMFDSICKNPTDCHRKSLYTSKYVDVCP